MKETNKAIVAVAAITIMAAAVIGLSHSSDAYAWTRPTFTQNSDGISANGADGTSANGVDGGTVGGDGGTGTAGTAGGTGTDGGTNTCC